MTAIIETPDGPCIVTMVTTDHGSFECREYPVHVARFRSVLENRPPVKRQGRDAGGRYGASVLA